MDSKSAIPTAKTCTRGYAAAYLGVSRPIVNEMIDSGQLPTVTIGKRRRVPLWALEAAIGKPSQNEVAGHDAG